MLIFVEHIRKLTIKFICLFQFRFSNTVTISPLKGWDTLSVFLLTIYVSIEVSGISLYVTNQVIDIQIMLLFYIGLDFPSQSFKFCPKFTTASLFRFCVCFISSTNLPSYLRGYPRYRRYQPTGFRGDMLISRLLNKGSYQIKVFLNRAIIRVTTEVPIFWWIDEFWWMSRKWNLFLKWMIIHVRPKKNSMSVYYRPTVPIFCFRP